MSKLAHQIYIGTLSLIVILTTIYLFYIGLPYYMTPLEERFYHPNHDYFKPSGLFGHGLGIIGTLLILIGVFGYIAKKRYKFLARFGRLKYWLEFHIFLCTLGPIMVLFHTAFKFGGIVSISFWSMVAVVLSGVIGRFIYVQIPHTIDGKELSIEEIKVQKAKIEQLLAQKYQLELAQFDGFYDIFQSTRERIASNMFSQYFKDRKTIQTIRKTLKNNQIPKKSTQEIIALVKNELALNNRLGRLQTMKKLFQYWHVAHLPFAVIMLVIMVIHVAITLAFGYKWIF